MSFHHNLFAIPLPPELCSELNLTIVRQLRREAGIYQTIARVFEKACLPVPPRGYRYRPSIRRFNQRIMAQVEEIEAQAAKVEEEAYHQEEVGWAFYIKT